MKITKKLLAVILSALVLAGAMPVMAVSAEELVDSNGIKYAVEENVAEVIGYTGEATELAIPAEFNGLAVKTIGKSAFENNKTLTNVIIPESVEVIKENAFLGCTALEAVEMPDSVTSVNGGAFADCTALKSVVLSDALAYLGPSAFRATAIEEIYIPKALTDSSDEVFGSTYEFDGVNYNLARGPFVLCENLKTVKFESGITEIGDYLFAGCVGLEKIDIPETVTAIEEAAFLDCLRLSEVNMGDAVTVIGHSAFRNNVSLEGIELSTALKSLGTESFGNTALKAIEIPRSLDHAAISVFEHKYTFDGISYSVEKGPFVLCENLKTVTFQRGTSQIAQELFAGCISIEEITIPDTVTSIEPSAFEDCIRLKKVEIPDTVTVIDESAFASCISLKEVKLPANLKELKSKAFAYTPIESIEIPKSLEKASEEVFTSTYDFNGTSYSVERGPFVLCENLKTVTFEKGSKRIADCILAGAVGIEEIVIPEGVESINFHAFNSCVRLKDITFPTTLKTIGEGAFYSCVSMESMIVPESVERIEDNAFKACLSLEKVEVKNPDAVIDAGAFASNPALKEVKLPANLKILEDDMFNSCTALESIELPETLEKIEAEAFYGCSSLDEVEITGNVREIGNAVFMNCTALKSINIPQSARVLGREVFLGCENLAEVDFADYSVKEIKNNTFKDCYSLKSIALPKGIITIGEEAFMNCIELFDVVIPESADSIAANAFSYPAKTTIYSQTGSYVEDFAVNGGFKFVDNVVEYQSLYLADGADRIVLEVGEKVMLEFEGTPDEANEVINLEVKDKWIASLDGMMISAGNIGVTQVTASTFAGTSYTFDVCVRGVEKITVSTKTSYNVGDEFDKAGTVVKAVYTDGTEVEVTDYTVNGFDSSNEGKRNLTFKWENDGKVWETSASVEIVKPEPEFEIGDVNGDAKLNIKDVTAIQKYVAKIVEFDDSQIALADFNGDTKVNVKDATTIQKKIAGLI